MPDELAVKAGVENPTTTMAEAVKRVFATEEAKAADANKPEPATEATATGDAGGSSLPMPWVIGGA